MQNIFLTHWKEDELASFSEPLRDAGWRVDTEHEHPARAVERIATLQPDVVVVSLRHEPAHGRELARLIAGDDAARAIPVVAVDGDEDDVEAVRSELPDATTVSWTELPGTLRELLDQPTG